VDKNTVKGQDVFTKHGEIETYGGGRNWINFQDHASITFTDGEKIGPVRADASIDPYIKAGNTGTWTFVQNGEFLAFVSLDLGPNGVRYADTKVWRKVAGSGYGVAAPFAIVAVLIAAFGLAVGFVPMLVVAAAILLFVLPGILRANSIDKLVTVIITLRDSNPPMASEKQSSGTRTAATHPV
jgi:hypothetical protein